MTAAEPPALPELLPPEGVVRAHLAFDPAYALPGEVVAGTLVLRARAPIESLSADVSLPEGLDYLSDQSGQAEYDPATRTLRWAKLAVDKSGLAEFPFRLQVNSARAGTTLELVPKVRLAAGDERKVDALPAAVVIGQGTIEQAMSVEGGTLALSGGRVTLHFAPGALKSGVTMRGGVFVEQEKEDGLPTLTFRVEPELNFDAPVTVTVDLRGLVSEAHLASGIEPILAYQRVSTRTEEATLADGSRKAVSVRQIAFEPLASAFNAAQGVLVASLQHFSSYTLHRDLPGAGRAAGTVEVCAEHGRGKHVPRGSNLRPGHRGAGDARRCAAGAEHRLLQRWR